MRNQRTFFVVFVAMTVAAFGCIKGSGGKGGKGGKGNPYGDGQVTGVQYSSRAVMDKPKGMVQIKSGTFHMGASDEDLNFNYSSRNKQVSIKGFWMDACEITNSQYLQFVQWVRDSLSAKELGYLKDSAIDWSKAKNIKYSDPNVVSSLNNLVLDPNNRLYGRPDFDPEKVVYNIQGIDFERAAHNPGQPISNFIYRYNVKVYPDTLVWMRDFSYSYNEPMTRRYFNHPAYAKYPVVGVNWKQAVAFCKWRTHYLNSYLATKKMPMENDFRLPTEAEWEYAARGGRSQSMYPWGNYYLRNKYGCLLANFKPGRGNYAEDGAMYTARVDSYWPNDFGLYNMAGNVAEWTSSYYYESADNFIHDMNPDIHWNALDSDPPRMKRKVVRGGSWKDVGYYLQTGTRTFEYQDTARSYIGFRCVIDLPTVSRR